ncbi:MAG: response regulator [Bacteroidales bacterium]|nr:response regulator [Bacteroidales bacterium]
MMETTNQTILLVDDEDDILEFLSYNLKKSGYTVYTALNGEEGIKKAIKVKPDLIILDVMMPVMDGIETCEQLRNMEEIGRPIIVFLTARSEDYSQIAGLDVGADDYITKPIKPKVFVSKIKSLLRRAEQSTLEQGQIRVINEHFKIDRERYIILINEEEITLPRKEFELLLLFTSKIDKVFTREEIFSKVWGNDVIVGDRTIDVHIRKIREKIGNDYIRTMKGVGYKFVNP